MTQKFTKMHGLGNDFMVLDGTRSPIHLSPEKIRTWADRHTGVGFDQLLLLRPSLQKDADFLYRIFNADGGEVEQCGNGARCVTKFILDKGLSSKKSLRLQTINQILICSLEADGNVTVNMGSILQPIKLLDFPEFNLTADFVDIGNPHAVIQVESTASARVAEIGSVLAVHPIFPNGANIGFMEIISADEIRLRVFERGAGETQACGTGACAAAVVARARKNANAEILVHLRGGEVRVKWEGEGHSILMTGPAVTVFEGEIS